MANYKLGPVIGKIGGGAEVQKIPVEAATDGLHDTTVVMHTVTVPPGETWLVALIGNLNPRYTHDSGPVLSIGGVSVGPSLPSGRHSIAAEVTGTAEITLKRNAGVGTDRFSGHAYVAPLPD